MKKKNQQVFSPLWVIMILTKFTLQLMQKTQHFKRDSNIWQTGVSDYQAT